MMYIDTETKVFYKSIYDIQRRCNLLKDEVISEIRNGKYKPINKRQFNNMVDNGSIIMPNIEMRYLEYFNSLDKIEIG